MADIEDYTGLLSAYHRGKPNFTATVRALCDGMVDLRNLYAKLPDAYDLDLAVGRQLDAVGLWVGLRRRIKTPLAGVYFSNDIDGLGFDQGVWQGPFDPDSGLTELDDDTYRLLLRAKIGANHWDGTLETSAAILGRIFGGGTHVFIQDNGDMSVDIGIAGTPPSALFLALLTGGYIPLKPEGVRISYYVIPSAEGPLFGFDVQNQYISGFDGGLWGSLFAG